MTDDEDNSITQATLADPDALSLDNYFLARMQPASAAEFADIRRRLHGRPRRQKPSEGGLLRSPPPTPISRLSNGLGRWWAASSASLAC